MEFHYLLLLPVTMIIGWLMTFIISGHFRQLHDRILIALLVCCCFPVFITARKLVTDRIDCTFILFDNIETVFAMAVCPLSFLYIRTVSYKARWHRWYCWLFAPGVIFGIIGTILGIVIGWDRILEIRQAHNIIFLPGADNIAESLYKWICIDIFDLTLEVMSAVLIGWSVYYLTNYHKNACNYFADIEESSTGRMHYFLLFSILIFTTVFFITFFIRDLLCVSDIVLLGISLWLSALLYGLAYNAYRIRLTDKHMKSLELAESQEPAGIPDDALELKISSWEKDGNKPFLNGRITLADVAEELKVTPRMLSHYINSNRGMNFSRWINTLRIEEAKRILTAEPDTKIVYVSDVCGFTNPAVFSKTFHNIVGCSPQTFRDSRQNIMYG